MTALRARVARVWESLFPAPLDMGLPERVPAREVLEIVERVKVRECRSDDWDAHADSAVAVGNSWALLTDEDLLGLVAHMDLAPSRPHEPSAAERGAA